MAKAKKKRKAPKRRVTFAFLCSDGTLIDPKTGKHPMLFGKPIK